MGDLMGYYPSNPYITPLSCWDMFRVPLCSDPGGLEPL